MAAPTIARRSVLSAKAETTPGTAIAMSASDATFNATNVQINPVIEFEPREGQGGGLSQLAGTLGAYEGVATFSTEFYGGSSAPAWMTTLLLGCGYVASGLVYSPSSLPPEAAGSGTKNLTIGTTDGRRRFIYGAMGNAVFRGIAGKRVMIDWTFRGLWGDPSDVAILAPTYETTAPLRFASACITLAAYSPVVAEMTLDLGNEVVVRENAQNASGLHTAVIVGRRPVGQIMAEAQLIATWDVHAKWKAGILEALAATMGGAGNGIAFSAPKLQITNLQEQVRNGLRYVAMDFQLNRSAAAGDDELTITTA